MIDAAYPRGSFALTLTVKNEAKLLPLCVQQHLRAGASHVFVYFDGADEETVRSVKHIPDITTNNSISPHSFPPGVKWIDGVRDLWPDNMDVRKRLNTMHAAQLAAASGIEWIICLDPDEVVIPDYRSDTGSLRKLLATLDDSVDQILVPNMEALPLGAGSDNPFRDCTYFFRRFAGTEALRRLLSAALRRLTPHPKLHAWFDFLVYYIRLGGVMPRLMRHPITGERIPTSYFLGYSNHKAFVRSARAQHFKFNIHRWERASRSPKNVRLGHVLHYDMFDADYMIEKFRQRSASMMVPAFYSRNMLARIARELPTDVVRAFFAEHVAISNPRRLASLIKRGIVIPINQVAVGQREG